MTTCCIHALQWPSTYYHHTTSPIGFLFHSSKYNMRCIIWSKSFAIILPIPSYTQPNKQPFHLSTQTPFYKHYPSSSSTHNPSFLPRSTCPQFSQLSFSSDEIHKEPGPFLFESNTLLPHFKLYILPITLHANELLETIPQSTIPSFNSIRFNSSLSNPFSPLILKSVQIGYPPA